MWHFFRQEFEMTPQIQKYLYHSKISIYLFFIGNIVSFWSKVVKMIFTFNYCKQQNSLNHKNSCTLHCQFVAVFSIGKFERITTVAWYCYGFYIFISILIIDQITYVAWSIYRIDITLVLFSIEISLYQHRTWAS